MNEIYMKRCLELAKCGFGTASPNPMVGAVIVCDGKIIGEGYHRKCGEPHAEVNAVNSVQDKSLLSKSTIYVSLEPCAHVGRTPACADMLIEKNIPNIVVGSIDPFAKVAGRGIEKLRNAGRDVTVGVLKEECDFLNRRFFTYHIYKRPYIILKWAQTADRFIDKIRLNNYQKPLSITNDICKNIVHKWRSEEDAILVGKNTVILDNPQLNVRNWFGRNPIRVCIDKMCELSTDNNIFNSDAKTIVINSLKNETINNIFYCKVDFLENIVPQILQVLYEHEIESVIIEGGAKTLNAFIESDLWDEARVFTNSQKIENGIKSPNFEYNSFKTEVYRDVILEYFYKNVFFTPQS